MLTAMKNHTTEQQARAAVKKLRAKTDPKFSKEMSDMADSLDGLLSAASLMGQKGGEARAKKLSKKRRTEIARNAANARWGK